MFQSLGGQGGIIGPHRDKKQQDYIIIINYHQVLSCYWTCYLGEAKPMFGLSGPIKANDLTHL